MYLTSLSLTNFRVFSRLEVDMPRRILLLVGENAQGKTSFLEAIHFMSTLTSLQAQHDRHLINFIALTENQPVARLIASFQRRESACKIEIRLILEPGVNGNGRLRKEVLIDGVKRGQQSALGQFNSVIFLPQMMRILEGGPEERRKFMDMALSQIYQGYAEALNEYSQALTQRNALLKQLAERGGDFNQLAYWDEIIAKNGSLIIWSRIRALQDLELLTTMHYKKLTNNRDALQIIYLPAYDPLTKLDNQLSLNVNSPLQRELITLDEIQIGFQKKLKALHREEISRGVTTIGPHRDDLRLISNGIDLGIYGSRGQVRSAILSLKLAERDWMEDQAGDCPILLLDETLAELDIQHRCNLLMALGDCEQAVLTTTDLHLFAEEFTKTSTVWYIKAGKITQ
jgi:DNA replication and repair protein RecF